MATVDLNHVQFWAPPSNPFLRKQSTALLQSTSKSLCATSPRNLPAPLHNKADRTLHINDRSTFAIAAARHPEGDSAAGVQGGNNELTNGDHETDDDFPSVEELLGQVPHKGISTGGCLNSEDTLQHLEEPPLSTSISRPNPTLSRFDNGMGGSQGTRDKPVILEDDESDTPNPEAAAVSASVDASADPAFDLSKPFDPSRHEAWWDIEDARFVDADLRPFPPVEQDGLHSTPSLAQGQPYSHHHPPGSSQDQINQYDNGTTRGALNQPAPHSLPTPLDEDGGGVSDENATELERDMQLAFEEQEKSSSATAPSFHSTKQAHPQIQQENDQSGTGYGRLEGLRQGSPLRSQNHEEDPQEQRQRQQELAVEAMREDGDDEEKERELRGEKRRHWDEDEEISSGMHQSESSNCSHDINSEDNEDPQPAKRQRLPSPPIIKVLTSPCEQGSAPRLTPPSTTQPEMDQSPPQADHAHLSTPVNDEQHYAPPTSRSPSVRVESAPVAEYREWPFQGFLKRITIGDQTTYNLEFALPHIHEHLNLPLHSGVLGAGSKESSAGAVAPRRAAMSRKPGKELTREQESLLAKMVDKDRTWTEIGRHFPGHTLQSLKENFFTKQGGKPRKRGRKPGVKGRRQVL